MGVSRSPDDDCSSARARLQGVSPRGFDGRGNYTLGLRDQLLPEIDYMKVDKARGMNVSVVTTAKTDEEARKLLQFIGMPFRAGHRQARARKSKVEIWERRPRSRKESKKPKYKIRLRNRCRFCGLLAATCESSRSAVCASASSHSRATSLGLRRVAGATGVSVACVLGSVRGS